MNKVTVVIVSAIVLIFGGFATWAIIQNQSGKVDAGEYDGTKVVDGGEAAGGIADHVRGNREAPVIIVEYADFQCGGCAQSQPRMEELVEEYGDKLGIVFRHFPLNGHQNSIAASSAVEAAGLQGLFFEMADLVFKNQSVWAYSSAESRTGVLAGYFDRLGGDPVKFLEDMAKKEVRKKIDFDQSLGKAAKVAGTPSFFIDGEEIIIAGKSETEYMQAFRDKIDAKLKELGLEPGGVKKEETKE
jgi:protein-disulfide isomerase